MKIVTTYCKNCRYSVDAYYVGKGTPLMINVPPNHIKDHECKETKTKDKGHNKWK